jgi:preprotein translocase subunit SecG
MSGTACPVAVDRKPRLAYVPAFPSHRLRLFMFKFLLVLHAIIAASLVTVILMQRSEGGGLGMGGSPSGLMSARGAADFLTRATSVLATLFVGLAILLAVIAAAGHNTAKIDPSLARTPPATGQLAPPAPQPTTAPVPGAPAAPAGNSAVPLAQ